VDDGRGHGLESTTLGGDGPGWRGGGGDRTIGRDGCLAGCCHVQDLTIR
jgi:hypothetical protein